MRNQSEKDKHIEIFGILLSAALIAAVFLGGSAEKISLAMASVLFYSGHAVQAETTAVPSTEVTAAQPQTTAEIRSLSEEYADITETPSDIKALIKKYTELFKDDKNSIFPQSQNTSAQKCLI